MDSHATSASEVTGKCWKRVEAGSSVWWYMEEENEAAGLPYITEGASVARIGEVQASSDSTCIASRGPTSPMPTVSTNSLASSRLGSWVLFWLRTVEGPAWTG